MAAVTVIPDQTFFIQLGNFIVTLLVLNLLLFKPIREIIKKRSELMAGRMSEIEKFGSEADSKIKDYEATLDSARKEGADIRTALKDEGEAEEQKLMQEAGRDAAAEMKAARREIAAKVDDAKGALQKDVAVFAEEATKKILGRA